MKYAKEFSEYFSKKPVFSAKDIRMHFARQGISNQYAKLLAHNFQKNNRTQAVFKGVYTFQKDPIVAVFAPQLCPCYVGLQDALSMHGLWGQETIPVIITPRKARTGFRNVLGARILVKRVKREMFFGFESIKYSDYWIPVSDIEKTFIDFHYFNQPLDRKVKERILKKIDLKKMKDYLKKTPKKTREKIKKELSKKLAKSD